MTIDTDAIKSKLFASAVVRAQLTRDYGLKVEPANAEALSSALLCSLGQTPVKQPLAKKMHEQRGLSSRSACTGQ